MQNKTQKFPEEDIAKYRELFNKMLREMHIPESRLKI
jgi:hypothetical protein